MRILIATDGSPGADTALELVASSFDAAGVEGVDIVTVAPRDAARGSAFEAATGQPAAPAASGLVEAAGVRLADAGFTAVGEVLAGHPAEEIVKRAGRDAVDLVVLGTRGLGLAQRLFAGSVTSKVTRHAPVPVLVADRAGPIRRVLVAYDGSAPADAAARFAGGLPLRGVVEFTVATVYSALAPLTSGIAPTMIVLAEQAYAEELAEAEQQARAVAEAGAGIIRAAGSPARAVAVSGSPLDRLTGLAAEIDADLIVVGDRGRSGIQRFLLGSTSAALVTSPPTNVLVVRSRSSA
jgi:nucleotide-binding universal stress UspA family protein